MNNDDIRRMLLQQRRLFGGQGKLAAALGVSGSAVSRFIRRRNGTCRSDSQILQALGLEVVTVKTIKLKDEF